MGPKLKPVKKGPMDNYFKPSNTPENSPGFRKPFGQHQPKMSEAQHHRPVKPDKQEKHATHSFVWIGSGKTPINLTCDKAGTILDSLKRSAEFKKLAEKNQNKELVIVRDGKAISSHCPCRLIKGDHLTIKYIKASGELKPSDENHAAAAALGRRKHRSDELVIFHVLTKGRKNITRIMKNNELPKSVGEVTVYAYKGEKVKYALKHDNRFLEIVFEKNCALVEKGPDIKTEMLDLVDGLDGKTVQIIEIDKSPPPESPPQSLDDACEMQSESQRSESDSGENQDPQQQSTTAETVNDSAAKEQPKQTGAIQPEIIPRSEDVKRFLSARVRNVVKGMSTRLSPDQNLFCVEYGKNAETCREVRTMKKLMNLSDSVCHVTANGTPYGTGFLLFDKFVLTNGHVINNIYDTVSGQLREPVTLYFSHESLGQVDSGAKVEEVVGFEYWFDPSGHKYDWALLRLSTDQGLPRPLLNHFGFLPQSGGICIIGHPDGGVKKIDPCLIIPSDERSQVTEKHRKENPDGVLKEYNGIIHLVTPKFFLDVAESIQHDRKVLTYESCFYFGSSGSPVFDEHCNVVAMHSAGYDYEDRRRKSNSVIEFGYPLSSILEHMIIQMVKRGRFDVLKAYLANNYAQHTNIMANVKKLVESRNLIFFKDTDNNSVNTDDDESLRGFFEFLLKTEEPVPMDTD
ncbi:protein FAM111A-like [Notolabrus celidotus]|uniref:protein FAM111A-like n=1 Tax=Notolabrus celidotus TaxID=1203425 RepID=UPI001490439B|nr:protein FAM111A-like [Notolabrus celidotus]